MAGAAAIIVTAALCYGLSLFTALGAHPFWAQQVLIVGAIIGLALYAVPKPSPLPKTALYLVCSLVSFAVAYYGKTTFAASYAEDAFAGRLWFLGWHVTAATGFATIGAITGGITQSLRA